MISIEVHSKFDFNKRQDLICSLSLSLAHKHIFSYTVHDARQQQQQQKITQFTSFVSELARYCNMCGHTTTKQKKKYSSSIKIIITAINSLCLVIQLSIMEFIKQHWKHATLFWWFLFFFPLLSSMCVRSTYRTVCVYGVIWRETQMHTAFVVARSETECVRQ